VKHKVYAVYDSAAGAYASPFLGLRDEQVLRGFRDAVNNASQSSDLVNHPGDFALFRLGEFDDSTGIFTGEDPAPMILLTALGAKRYQGPTTSSEDSIDGAA